MDKKMIIRRKKKLFEIILLSIIFFTLGVLQMRFDLIARSISDITHITTANGFHGVVSCIKILIAVAMVTISVEGYYTAMVLYLFEIVIVISQIFILRLYGSIPGVATSICGIVVIWMIHSYLCKLDQKEKELFEMAHTDSLTELPNRRSLNNEMHKLNEDDGSERYAVVMIDLDNFKNINDTIGHEYGDKVLLGIADRWRSIKKDDDFIARLGGDEFAILIRNYASLSELEGYLQKILGVVSERFELKGQNYYISASLGVSLYPSDSTNISQLLKYADMAMYAAKSQGKKCICYFDNMMDDVIEKSVEVEGVLRRAVEEDMFRLVYQPQFSAETKKLRGFETLIRLSDGEGKQVTPNKFIPIAEKSALIYEVDCWVLEHAMRDMKPFIDKNPDLILSINISANHLLDEHFLHDVDFIMHEVGFKAQNLEIELTESACVESIDRAKIVMQELKKRGIHIALDDFGTGYSSLSYLKELPIDLLKIDKKFIDTILDGPKEESFIAAIISLGQVMQFSVISEGVEMEDQLAKLQMLGCDYIQGFLWGKPLKLADVEKMLH